MRAWAWWALPRGGVILGAAAFLVPASRARDALCLLAAVISVVAVLTGAWAHPSDHSRAGGGVTRTRRRILWQTRTRLGRRLAHRALHDRLTGLANGQLFVALVGAAVDRRRPGTAAVVLADLDDFKSVNEGLGHHVGDELLVAVAERLRGCLAPGDVVARLEADEFGILLDRVDGPGPAKEASKRILAALREPFAVGSGLVTVTASIGVAVAEEGGQAAALIKDADLALHTAKGKGRGRVEAFRPGMHEALVERLTLKTDMQLALARGEFVSLYQPIVELETGRLAGAEALLRWDHPSRGMLPPAQFIAFAEESGLIVPIGLEVLRRACLQLVEWDRHLPGHPPLRVSVNLSAGQVHDPDLVGEVAGILERSGIDPGRVTLEITESILLSDADASVHTLTRLKTLGLRLALDDFGTGFSSLSYLQRLPVDVLKLDKSFVDQLGSPTGIGDARLASAIISLGRALDLVTTAEGIERGDQLARLRELGCRLGQGYYFARPMTAVEIEDEVRGADSDARARIA